MRPRSHYGNSLHLLRCFGWASACVLMLYSHATASKGPGSVIARDTLTTKHRTELTAKLSVITGWRDLRFDNEGLLQVGAEESRGGSRTARELLESAIQGKNIIIVDDASSRVDVAFCRVVPGRWIGTVSRPQPVYIVLIDFTDFQQITGDDEARAAFNVAWGFLHEIDHVVNDSEDPRSISESAGDCENHINRMRDEVGLPVRAAYFFSPFPVRADPNFMTRLVRLSFVDKKNAIKGKRYWLVWDAAVVGGSSEQWQTSLVSPPHNNLVSLP